MSDYPVPALSDIITQIDSDIVSRDPDGASLLPTDPQFIVGRALAGAVNGLYGYITQVAEDIPYDTASEDIFARWAGIWNVPRKLPTPTILTVAFTGGTTTVDIPVDTVLARSDGVQYETTADLELTGGAGSTNVTCLSVGSATNMTVGQTLTLAEGITGVTSTATVTAVVQAGTDVETLDSWRGRLIARIQQPPMGGCLYDYVTWALQVPGVTRAWAYQGWQGQGTVGLTFMMDARANPIPQAADVTIMQNYVEPLRPAGCPVTYFAPTPVALNLTIHLNPNNATIQAAVQAQIQALITREAVPGGTLLLSHIWAAISAAAGSGENDFTMTSPTANVTVAAGSILVFGAITWD